MGVISCRISACYFPLPLVPSRRGRGKFTFYDSIKSKFWLLGIGIYLMMGVWLLIIYPPQPQYILHIVKTIGLAHHPEGCLDGPACKVISAVGTVNNL